MERILITGASRGIGRAIAVRLAAKGRTLLLHGRDRKALEEAATRVTGLGATAEILLAELDSVDSLRAMIRQIGVAPLHGLINNAGVPVVRPIDAIELEDWNRSLAVNVTAPFLLTQKLLPSMPSGGTIVNILSVAARTGFPQWSAYCAHKAALDGFSRALREELRPRAIRVVCVFPAATDTDIWRGVPGDWDRSRMMAPERVADAVACAYEQPADVVIDEISIGGLGGNL